ncbi:MAG TPA: magnesium transporter [Vitreimonas sp.]|nr:magnesium transporter [Vitreimonas sp.]
MSASRTKPKLVLTNDLKEHLGQLLIHRLPWLIMGLGGACLASLMTSSYETMLKENISLAFFMPAIVYMSDAVGTQTETIFVRNLTKYKVHFFQYVIKELLIGVSLGLVLGLLMGVIAWLWLGSVSLALTIALALGINITLAPVISVTIPQLLWKEGSDPALGAGPFTTIALDVLSLFIYFTVASLVLFSNFFN